MALLAAQVGFIDNSSGSLLRMMALPGRTAGMETPEYDNFTAIDPVPLIFAVDSAVHAGGAPGAPGAAGVALGELGVPTMFNTGLDWFEKVHIFPGDSAMNPNRLEGFKIDFGNILAQAEEEYEIYNAFRHTAVTLNTIINNTLPGTETPDVVPPDTLAPQTSLLGPTSTFNTGLTTGLGVKVKVNVRVLLDGLPSFDDTIDFLFSPGNTVELPIAGQRIALLVAQYGVPLQESMAFFTDVIASLDGHEQRLALRKNPRERWAVTFDLTADDRQRFDNTLMDWQDNNFGLPLWHEQCSLTAAVSPGATIYQTRRALNVDFRVGGLAVVFQDAFTFDVLTLTAVTDTQLTSGSASANGYAAGALLVPVRVVRVANPPSGRAYPINLEQIDMVFEAVDNDTGVPAGATTWNPNTYNGRVLLDETNVMVSTVPQQFDRRIITIDNETGVVSQGSPWDKSKRVHAKGFAAHSRQKVKELKALLRFLRGRQKSFYIPTFNEDLTIVANIGIGTSTLDITHVGYVRFVKNRNPKRIFKITFTDGTSLIRVIQSSATVSASVERLTLDTTWPANRTIAQVRRIQFYELVRFDTDEFNIDIPRIGQAFLTAPVKVVFDDD